MRPAHGDRLVSEAAGTGQRVRPKVLLFFDYACAFCYVDRFRLERLSREYAAEVVPVPFELRPEMPAEGFSAEAHALRHTERVESYLRGLARREGFPLRLPDHIPNTHRGLVMGEVARDAGDDVHALTHEAIFAAYFGEGRDIGRQEVLLDVAGAAGLDVAAVENAWRDGSYDARLRSFARLAANLGVSSTPSALVCNELLIGTRPYRQMAEAVQRCLVTAGTAARDA